MSSEQGSAMLKPSVCSTSTMVSSHNQYAGSVLGRIESQISTIDGLMAQVSAILNRIAALRPPAREANEEDSQFQRRLEDFQRQLERLNQNLQTTKQRLRQAEAELRRLETSELPAAERKDREAIERALEQHVKQREQAQKALEQQAKAQQEALERQIGQFRKLFASDNMQAANQPWDMYNLPPTNRLPLGGLADVDGPTPASQMATTMIQVWSAAGLPESDMRAALNSIMGPETTERAFAIYAIQGANFLQGSTGPQINSIADLVDALPNLSNANINIPLDAAAQQAILAAGKSFDQANLSGAVFHHPVTRGANLSGANLTGATFAADVSNVWFFGAKLQGTTFLGAVQQNAFLYADVDGADFSGATQLRQNDFAFTQNADTMVLATNASGNVFTGTPLGSDRMLTNSIWMNDPALVASLDGPDGIRDLVADEHLFDELQRHLPAGSLDAALPPSWRSALWDQMESMLVQYRDDPDPLTASLYWGPKSHVFDAVDQRYGSYTHPVGGQKLTDLYNYESTDGSHPFRAAIEKALERMLLGSADQRFTLADPFGGLASPVAGLPELRKNARAIDDRIEWMNSTANINGQKVQMQDIALPPDAISYLRGVLLMQAGGPHMVETLDRLSADGLVSARQLEREIGGIQGLLHAYFRS